MSFLYDVAFLSAGATPFAFRDLDVGDLPSTALFASVVKDAEADEVKGETIGYRAKRMRS